MPFGIDSATFNVLVGAVIALFSSVFVSWNGRRVRRDRLRRSLVHEVDHIGTAVERFLTDDGCKVDDTEEALVNLSTDVLDANFAQLTKLTTAEIESAYEFYEATELTRRELRRRRDGEEYDPNRLRRRAQRTVAASEAIQQNVTRSRLSRLIEWYKDIESGRR